MAGGNYLSFGGAVEQALMKPKTGVGPVYRAGAKPTMRTVTGKATTVGDDVLKLTGKAAPKAAGAGAGKLLGKLAVPLAVAEQVYQAGKLLLSEDARDEAAQDYRDSANEGAVERTVKGALGGVTTIYGLDRALRDVQESERGAAESGREVEKKLADPETQKLLQSVKERQAAFMRLSPDDRDLVDSMPAKQAKQYIQDNQPAPPTSTTNKMGGRPLAKEPATAPAAAPAAPAAAPAPERDLNALFLKATGTAFDPKSRLDVARKAELEDLLKGDPSLAGKSDTQVALQWYRKMANAKRK
jgi:hypothetical protein